MKKTLTIAVLIAAVMMLPTGCANKKNVARAPQRTQVNSPETKTERHQAKKRDIERRKQLEVLRAQQAEQQRIQDSIALAEAQAEAELLLELARQEEAERQRVQDSIARAEELKAMVKTMKVTRMTVTLNVFGKQITSPATLHWQRGTGMTLSIQPIAGIEMFRMETNAETVTFIDKINRRYARLSYEELAKMGAETSPESIDRWIDNNILARRDEPQLVLQVTRAGTSGSAVIYTNTLQTDVNVNTRPTNVETYKQVSPEQFAGGIML